MTTLQKLSLASDNCSPAHPLVLQAINEANHGYTPSYGADPWTGEASELVQKAFNTEAKVIFVPTGTGSNVFALKLALKPYQSVISSDMAHIAFQESGAPEALIGCKLLAVPSKGGKVTPEAIVRLLKIERAFGKHATSPRVLSIAQPTEVGTVYTLAELKALSKLCKEENLLMHMDGSRLYNAAVALNVPLHEITAAAQVDILSLGGTKNGLMGAEALVIFNSELQEGSDYLQKQMLQLLSKMRYLSAQYIPFFKNDLWHALALHANRKAQEIASLIASTKGLCLNYPVETNQIFFSAPPSKIAEIRERVSCHLWDAEKNELRFVTSWCTSDDDVEQIRSIL